MNEIEIVAAVIVNMDRHLRKLLTNQKMLWENTFIKHQLDKRKEGGNFSIRDHIRGMVYSMTSSCISWKRVVNLIDLDTGKITKIDNVFHQYDPDYILKCKDSVLYKSIKSLNLAGQCTKKQLQSLGKNISKMLSFENQYGSIDNYYKKYITEDCNLTCLVRQLSATDSVDKYYQMGCTLIAEYLKNIGYDIAKPDRHICRLLGSKYLGCSNSENANPFEVFAVVQNIADKLGMPAAEVDYILWAYCAEGYGEICSRKNPKCNVCVANNICRKIKE